MKHVKTLSSVKPMQAQEAAWWTLGNFFKGPILGWIGNRGGRATDADRFGWLGRLLDDLLQG
jgi:hypothetical protein